MSLQEAAGDVAISKGFCLMAVGFFPFSEGIATGADAPSQ